MTAAGGPGRWLRVLGLGHTALGAWIYRDVLAETAHEVRSRGPAALVGAVPFRGDRATAFWFLLAGPALWTVGRTLRPGDRVAAGALAATGVAGSVLLPGGFPAVAALGAWAALAPPPRPDADTVTAHVGVADAPTAVRARSSLAAPDYLDHYTLPAPGADAWAAERWARVMFEQIGGRRAQAIWRGLGLRVDARPSADRVAGWRIDGRGGGADDDWVRLHAASWWGRAQLVVHRDAEHLSLTTVWVYDRPAGPAIWGPVSAVHGRVVPGLLSDTRRALERSPRP